MQVLEQFVFFNLVSAIRGFIVSALVHGTNELGIQQLHVKFNDINNYTL